MSRTAYLQPGQVFASHEPATVTTILGSCVAVVLLPPAARLISHSPSPVVLAAALAAAVVIVKHVENLKRLARGEERKLGRK